MAEAMDLILFIDSESSDNHKRLEPTFIPDYRNFAFTKSELNLLQNEVIDELFKEGITLKQKKYLERLSSIVNEMIIEYHISYFKINGEFPDGWWNDK
jgi:hypothetical protein